VVPAGREGGPRDPILILTGPPGVGKTTTADILSSRNGRTVHLEADAFFRFIRSGYIEPWRPESHEQNETVMRVVAAAASGYAGAGYSTIVDGIVIPGWFFEPLRDALRDMGHPVAYAVLRAPRSVCVTRVDAREGRPPTDPDAIDQLWQSFAQLGDLERHVVDVEGKSPDEAAALIAQRLDEGSLIV
jgi:tRNA uridine 5-carbamoylmethylation protein Kti12